MSPGDLNTVELEDRLQRMNAGDRRAREELFLHATTRLERLTRKMLKRYPNVHRWAQTDDVLQNALARLLRSLEQVKPATLRDFFGLSTEMIRRELIDLARHYFGPQGMGANHASSAGDESDDRPPAHERADSSADAHALLAWQEFHERIKELPEENFAVFDLVYYQDLTQSEAARLLGISERTVQRRWQAALVEINKLLGGRWPG